MNNLKNNPVSLNNRVQKNCRNSWAVYGLNEDSWAIGKIIGENELSDSYIIQYFERQSSRPILYKKEEVRSFGHLEEAVDYFLKNSSPFGYHLFSEEEILNSLEVRFPTQARKEYIQDLTAILMRVAGLKNKVKLS